MAGEAATATGRKIDMAAKTKAFGFRTAKTVRDGIKHKKELDGRTHGNVTNVFIQNLTHARTSQTTKFLKLSLHSNATGSYKQRLRKIT